jgi:hypothetical protein
VNSKGRFFCFSCKPDIQGIAANNNRLAILDPFFSKMDFEAEQRFHELEQRYISLKKEYDFVVVDKETQKGIVATKTLFARFCDIILNILFAHTINDTIR